jgi:hypothetical protein
MGVAVTGLGGGLSATLQHHLSLRHSLEPYGSDRYLRTGRFMASVLRGDPQSAARTLVMPLVRMITMEGYNPLPEASS